MIKKQLLLASAATLMLSTACVDDNYNLSDIDGTIGINVNELTIPLNTDSLTLNQVIDLEDTEQIKKVETSPGKFIYALVEDGEFDSDPIDIPDFTAEGEYIEPIIDELSIGGLPDFGVKSLSATKRDINSVHYALSTKPSNFSNKSEKVDEHILDVDSIGVSETYFDVEVKVGNELLYDKVDALHFENLILKMPRGLKAVFTLSYDEKDNGMKDYDVTKNYDIKTGLLNLSATEIKTTDGKISLNVNISEILITNKNDNIHYDAEFIIDDTKNENNFSFAGEVGVNAGELVIYENEIHAEAGGFSSLPTSVPYVCTPILSDITASTFSGKISYNIDNLNIDPVALNDLPDFLNDDETNIKLSDPQIYLKISNPLASSNVYAETGLKITQIRYKNNSPYESDPFTLDANAYGDPGKLHIGGRDNTFCLTSDLEFNNYQSDYRDASTVAFTGLSDIISLSNKDKQNGLKGLPKELKIEITDPQVPEQLVKDFALGQEDLVVKGNYEIFAPLALDGETSVIVYSDTVNDWYDETLEKLTIKGLKINAKADSDVPLKVTLKIKPIGLDGEVLVDPITKEKIESNVIELEPHAKKPLDVEIKGNIVGLDGIIFEAKLFGDNGEAISPDQKIDIKNLKITISGRYVDEM